MTQAPDTTLTTTPADTLSASDTLLALADSSALMAADSVEIVTPVDSTETVAEDSVEVVMPADSAFLAGTLSTGQCSPHRAGRDYSGESCLLADILIAICVILTFLFVRKFIHAIPSAFSCLGRWREAISLEYDTKFCRDRDYIFVTLFIPACLILDRHSVIYPSFMSELNPTLHLLVSICVLIVYYGLRVVADKLFRNKKWETLMVKASFALFRSFFIVAIPLELATLCILSLTSASALVTNHLLLWESIILFVLFLLRRGQILVHHCTVFSTILYLCSLEILPLCILAVPAIII